MQRLGLVVAGLRAALVGQQPQEPAQLGRFDLFGDRDHLGLQVGEGGDPGAFRGDHPHMRRGDPPGPERRMHHRQVLQGIPAGHQTRTGLRIGAGGHRDQHPGAAGVQHPGIRVLISGGREVGQVGVEPVT
ncbi:MAG: hypothetical protein IPG68_10080 [Micrococcales bacterium]|nr:hypothetical protein [Micrococcales bacterium]